MVSEADAFAHLQRNRLEAAWRADLPGSTTARVVVGLPSYSLDRSVLEHYGARVAPLENRYLYAMLRAADAWTRVVYLSSRPVPQDVLDAYMALVPPEQHERILARTLLISPDDVSPQPLARKVCARPDLIEQIQRFIGDDLALIEAWNVTPAERDLALAIDAPINGTDPALWRLGTKSEARRLFRTAGVPHPPGMENLCSVDNVVAAITTLRRRGQAAAGVVVKLDDSVAGDGNVVLPARDLPQSTEDVAGWVRRTLPAWYQRVLRDGGVVEELVAGDGFCSPSAQATVRPDGDVEVLATHDQRLGGATGQVFEGCTFPAADGYANQLVTHITSIGEALAALGVIGRFAADFVAVRSNGGWRVNAVEINLRKGGTTHPYGITRLLTGGRFDPDTNRFVLPDGSARFYAASDNLVDAAWVGRKPAEVHRRVGAAGLSFDRASATGVVVHLLDCLRVDGRMGYTALAPSREEVQQMEQGLRTALQ